MSIKRYGFDYRGDSCESSNGEWVRYADHAAEVAASELLRLEDGMERTGLQAEIAALRARCERLAAECRLWREWAGETLTGWPCVNGQPITRAVDAHRDLEGGAA